MKTKTVRGYYGSQKTPCDIYACGYNMGWWYVVDGSVNVNFTYEDMWDGMDVECVSDVDMFTAPEPINSEEDLINAVES